MKNTFLEGKLGEATREMMSAIYEWEKSERESALKIYRIANTISIIAEMEMRENEKEIFLKEQNRAAAQELAEEK